MTKKDVKDIYACRAYLNGLAAKSASEQMTPEVLGLLEQVVDQMAEAAQTENVRQYFQLTVRFNELVVECAANQMLRSLMHSLGRRTLRLRYLSITTPGRVQAGLAFHRELLDAFRSRNASQAEHLMMRQILDAQAVLLSHFLESESA